MKLRLTVLIFVTICGMASAEVLVLETGKTLKIKNYSVEGSTMRAALNDNGEMAIPIDWVREIRPSPPEPEPKQASLILPDFAYSDLVFSVSKKHEMDWKLIFAVMAAESNFNPRAISPKGARGLMQLMPDTAKIYHVRNPYDPLQNIEAGVRHLKMLIGRYDGKLDLVLAAYNSGEKAVDFYRGIPPYQETKEYVKRVLQFYKGLSASI